MEKELEKKEARFRSFFEEAPYAIHLFSDDGKLKMVNPEFNRITGYTEDDIRNLHTYDLVFPEDKEISLTRLQKLVHDDLINEEIRLKGKNGKEIFAEIEAIKLSENENISFWKDITRRKRLEDKLRKEERKFRSYFDSSPNPILIINKFGKILNTNKASHNVTGYSDEEVLNMSVFDFIAERDIDKSVEQFNKLIKQGTGVTELLLKTKSGSEIPVMVEALLLNDNDYIFFWKDLSGIKKAQEIKDKEKYYLETLKLAKIGIGTSDLINNKISWSDEMFEILGLDKDKGVPEYNKIIKTLYPYDWEEFDKNNKLAWEKGIPYEQILTVKTPKGEMKRILAKTNCEKDAEGKVVRLFGIVQDITDLK
jgi:PAS domain S-box-containing protein